MINLRRCLMPQKGYLRNKYAKEHLHKLPKHKIPSIFLGVQPKKPTQKTHKAKRKANPIQKFPCFFVPPKTTKPTKKIIHFFKGTQKTTTNQFFVHQLLPYLAKQTKTPKTKKRKNTFEKKHNNNNNKTTKKQKPKQNKRH